MFSQQQDIRQQMPGMHMQPQGQVQHMGGQMPMQMGNPPPQQQQPMGGMPGMNMQQQQRPTMGAPMGHQQHSMSGPGTPQQMGMPRPVVGGPPQQQIMVKSEIGATGHSPQVSQRMPAPSNQQQQQQNQSQDAQLDRIVKFKQLLPHLKECLVTLIAVARQNFAANATIDNLEKSIDTSLIPRFDKELEQFFSICNQIEMHLMLANDQISHTLFSMQYTPLTANQMKENANNMQVYTSYVNTVKQQLTYAKEIQNMLAESSNKILARQGKLQQQQPRQQQQF